MVQVRRSHGPVSPCIAAVFLLFSKQAGPRSQTQTRQKALFAQQLLSCSFSQACAYFQAQTFQHGLLQVLLRDRRGTRSCLHAFSRDAGVLRAKIAILSPRPHVKHLSVAFPRTKLSTKTPTSQTEHHWRLSSETAVAACWMPTTLPRTISGTLSTTGPV